MSLKFTVAEDDEPLMGGESFRKVWKIRHHAANGVLTPVSIPYRKLSSAINFLEKFLCDLQALEGIRVESKSIHKKKRAWVFRIGRRAPSGDRKRFAFHYRHAYGYLEEQVTIPAIKWERARTT